MRISKKIEPAENTDWLAFRFERFVVNAFFDYFRRRATPASPSKPSNAMLEGSGTEKGVAPSFWKPGAMVLLGLATLGMIFRRRR